MKPIIMALMLTSALFAAPVKMSDRLSIKVDPQVTVKNGNVWVTCFVPRHSENRKITIGIHNHLKSSERIDGKQAPDMFVKLFSGIPCRDEVVAECVLEAFDGIYLVDREIPVARCQ